MAPRFLACVIVCTALLSAGCGSFAGASGPATPPPPPAPKPKTIDLVALVARAATRTQAAGSTHVVVVTTGHLTGVAGHPLTLTGSGDVAYRPVREHLWFHYSVDGTVGVAGAILTGNVLYQYWPRMASRLPGGRPWYKERVPEIGSKLGITFGGIMNGASTSNPFQMLTNLQGTSHLVLVGRAKIGGVPTNEYRGSWDYRKLARRGLITRRGVALLDGRVSNPTPFSVWIGRDGLVHQLVWHRMYLDRLARSFSETSRFNYSNFGEPVSINLPPVGVVSEVTSQVIANSRLVSGD